MGFTMAIKLLYQVVQLVKSALLSGVITYLRIQGKQKYTPCQTVVSSSLIIKAP